MKIPFAPVLAVVALCAAPLVANATVYQFTASLKASNEVGAVSTATATGNANLFYNDMGTPGFGDDSYTLTLNVLGLSGVATGFHIHGAASTTENGPVRVNLAGPSFFVANPGGFLLVGSTAPLAPPVIGATAAGTFNAGHAPMSFLAMLTGGLAYVNVHTALNPGGATRGQFVQVAAVVPEPSSYALLLAGLGVIGFVSSRRKV